MFVSDSVINNPYCDECIWSQSGRIWYGSDFDENRIINNIDPDEEDTDTERNNQHSIIEIEYNNPQNIIDTEWFFK